MNKKVVNNSPIQLIDQLKGLYYINPVLSLSLAITLFSFAGIPPLIGFFGKQMILSAAIDNGYIFMSLVAILTSVISAVYYLAIIKQIFFDRPDYRLNEELRDLNAEGLIVEKSTMNKKVVNNSPIQLIDQLKGLYYINPVLSLSLAITLFSFAGIPPLIGFFGKQMILSAAIDNGYIFMSLVAILTSVISAVYYLAIIKQIFFDRPDYRLNEELRDLNAEGLIVEKSTMNKKVVNNSPIQLIDQLKGLYYINPVLSLSLAITLFSFAGIPPLIGFFGKQMILSAAIDNGYIFMSLVAILTSVISAVYYLAIIKQIFFDRPDYRLNEELRDLNAEGLIVEKKYNE